MPGCIKPFIFCLFLFEYDRRELWIMVQVRGSDYTCAISDARTWTFIYPEVKTGLTPNHPLITRSPHQIISCGEKPEGSPLPGPWPWWEVMESAGQGAGWTVTQGTRPAIRPSTTKTTSCGVTWHCRKQSSRPRRLSHYPCSNDWTPREKKVSTLWASQGPADLLLETTSKSKFYIFQMDLSRNSFCVTKNHFWFISF